MVNRFSYHSPKDDQQDRYERIREAMRELALDIASMCPPSRERSLAITKLEEASMWANASIARNE
ncbi:MAG: hypothetical protein DRH30_07910 [Deltaproteobacteria bacterium]|nr:MAG: hypothetical protein DRH30_07910 [Deltaproteobacteria bacterium]